MLPEFIANFHQAITDVFAKMLRMEVEVARPTAAAEAASDFDVHGIIGLSGDIVGVVIVSFPTETAAKCVEAFAGCAFDPESNDFVDAIGELTNMISGAAKSRVKDKSISIACPTVALGAGRRFRQPSDSRWLEIACATEFGPFTVNICVREGRPAGAQAA